MKQSRKVLKFTAILLLWLIIWFVISSVLNKEILVPSPISTLNALAKLCLDKQFYFSVLYSLLRIIAGYLFGVVFGFLSGILSNKFSIFKAVTTPVLQLIKSVPVASFIILALVWFKSDILPIFISFLMVMPMVWSSVETGLTNIDKKYIELAQVYKLGAAKTFFQIKLPFILPNLIATSLTALGFAWKSGIAAEVICRPDNSLGNMLQESKIYIETPNVFALTFVVAILSLSLELFIKRILRRYTNDIT